MPAYSLNTIAKLICLTPRRIQQLVNDGVIPDADKGRYDLVQTVQGYIQYLQSISHGQGNKSLTEQRHRLAKIKADREEMALARDRGALIDTGLAMQLWGDIIMNIRAKLLVIPTKITPLVVGVNNFVEIRELLTGEMHEICNELANPDLAAKGVESRMGGRIRSNGNIPLAAKVKSQRVGGRKKISQSRVKLRTG